MKSNVYFMYTTTHECIEHKNAIYNRNLSVNIGLQYHLRSMMKIGDSLLVSTLYQYRINQ